MRTKSAILAEINAGLPNVDWRQGAQDYLAGFFERHTRAQIAEFVFTKPLGAVTPEDPAGTLTETVSYLHNFASSIQLLQLPRGARILDVACGGGWFTHWLRKLGYNAVGMDLSTDFIGLARQRLLDDPYLRLTREEAELAFMVHDFEIEEISGPFEGSFDAIVLESCLHHFFDPIAAMSHIAKGLAPNGVILVLEGENRRGQVKDEYMEVMLSTSTLERPYPREILIEILEHVGLSHIEFLGSVPGFYAQSAPLALSMTELLRDSTAGSNVCVCARDAAAVRRVVPTYDSPPPP
jgi:SAM-dependent methyltransferase